MAILPLFLKSGELPRRAHVISGRFVVMVMHGTRGSIDISMVILLVKLARFHGYSIPKRLISQGCVA